MSATANKPRDRLPSYRRRYTQIFAWVTLALALVSIFTHRYVVMQSQASSTQAALYERSASMLNDAFVQLYRVRQELYDFLLVPTPTQQTALDTALSHLDDALRRLAEQGPGFPEDDSLTIARMLQEDGRNLRLQIHELVTIRHDPTRWFPATVLIENEMQDSNTLFVAQLDALISSVRTDDPSVEPTATLLVPLFDLQKSWLRMVDELRLVIANRFGAHADEPLQGIRTRAENITLYASHVNQLLSELQQHNPGVREDPLIEAEITGLAVHARAWQEAFAVLITQLTNDDWRADLAYLRKKVDPDLRLMQQRLEVLRIELQLLRNRQIEAVNATSIRIANVLFAALALMLALGIIGFLSLDRLILRPILTLAGNLKAHAGQTPHTPPAPAAVSETRDLIDAFDEMRTQVVQRERELDHLAHHDALTGLPNRSLFRRRLGEALAASAQHGMLVGLLFMDLDRFKQINDSYGHAAGDQMLREIARRLLSVFRQEDVVARLGGDEFAVLLENLHERDEMMRLAEKALGAIERPYAFQDHMFYSGASIGIAVAPDDGTDPDRLIQLADTAMYACKLEEGSSFRFVSSEMSDRAAARHTLENELRDAIRQQKLELHFQPVVSTSDRSLHCFETLLRWPHAEQGMLQPASFMDALADAGLCSTISDWALDQIDKRRPAGNSVVSINLSARLLHDEHFAGRLLERIGEGRPPPEQLIIEITEDSLETDLRAAGQILHELQQRGVRVALDDFGTGQASLSHLRRFPFDYIKIDQSFIDGIGEVPNDEKLIRAIIGLAHALGMQVVAEGVETDAQFDFLRREHCDYVQGFLVGKPTADGS